MKCPACTNQLTEKTIADVKLHVCDGGCGGIWFEEFEFHRFDRGDKPGADELLHLHINPNVKIDFTKQRNCPECISVVMMRHFESIQRKVQIDECANCGGVWLDAGELKTIRDEYPSDEARRAATDKFFDGLFGKEMAEQWSHDEDSYEKAKQVANAFRFICPSYYAGKIQGAMSAKNKQSR